MHWEWIAKVLMHRLLKLAVKLGVRGFRDARGPEVHGKGSQKYMWDHVWLPLINGWRATPNEWDDIAADYTYWYVAGYISDGTLAELIRTAQAEWSQGHPLEAMVHLRKALALIEPPEQKK